MCSFDALLHPQIGATPLKFGLKQGRLGSMRALMLNYKCSLPGLMWNSLVRLLVWSMWACNESQAAIYSLCLYE